MVADTDKPGLSQADVERLMAGPTAEQRAELAAKVGGSLDSTALTDAERAHAVAIIEAMTRDAEVLVRSALADTLKTSQRLPHDLAIKLAQDVAEVSIPVLQYSTVLTDDDLVEIVRAADADKQSAVARRETVSEVLSDALIEHGTSSVVATLMANEGAQVSEEGFGRAIDKFGHDPMVQAPMAQRGSLPVSITDRLMTLVSDSLRDQLMQRYNLSEDVVTDLLLQSRERALLSLASSMPGPDVSQMAADLQARNQLTDSLILRSLFFGDVSFFEAGLAVRAEVPVSNAQLLIHDQGQLGLQRLVTKAGLPDKLLPAIRVGLQVVAETDFDGEPDDLERHRRRVAERILTQFEELDSGDLDYVIGRLCGPEAAAQPAA